jgi:hypothetical protein
MASERGSKSLSPEARASVRDAVRALVDGEFAGNKAEAARRLKVGYSQLHGIYEGTQGAGPKVLERIARHTGREMGELLGLAGRRGPADAPRFGQLPGWMEADRVARPLFAGSIPAEAFDAVLGFMGDSPPEVIDVETVAAFARAWWNAKRSRRSAELVAQARAEMAAEDQAELARIASGEPSREDHRGLPRPANNDAAPPVAPAPTPAPGQAPKPPPRKRRS